MVAGGTEVLGIEDDSPNSVPCSPSTYPAWFTKNSKDPPNWDNFKPAQVNVVLPRFELAHIGFAPPVASADVTHDLVVYASDGS